MGVYSVSYEALQERNRYLLEARYHAFQRGKNIMYPYGLVVREHWIGFAGHCADKPDVISAPA